jgi:23S rRNA (uracil1939-C5)-methyltransferase
MLENSPSPEVVVIERIAPGGSGLGRLPNGEVIFVNGTAPGDEVEISKVTRRKGTAQGEISRILRSGPTRIEPSCPLALRCGGCDLMHLSLEGQKQAKLGILTDTLRRVGGDPPRPSTIGFVMLGDGLGYRSRIRLHVDSNGSVGFLSTASKELVAVKRCLVAEPGLNRALSHFAELTVNERRMLAHCDQIELRAAKQEPQLLARLFPGPKSNLGAQKLGRLFPPDTQVVIAGSPEEERSAQQYEVVGDLALMAPATAFTQVHRGVNSELVRAVVRAATLPSLASFVDAYAGAGNFTLPLLAAGLFGEAIDIAASGILAARSVARDRGLPFDGFQVGDAKDFLESLARAGRQFDLVLLDPPRAGAKDLLSAALRLRPQLVVLVACDPVSLARDLKTLVSAGGRIEEITVFDMFPQTHHTETLAVVGMPV